MVLITITGSAAASAQPNKAMNHLEDSLLADVHMCGAVGKQSGAWNLAALAPPNCFPVYARLLLL